MPLTLTGAVGFEVRREVVIDVEQWAKIRELHFAEGMGIKTIARELGLSRNT